MAKKTYRTYRLKGLDIHLKDRDGKRVVVVFRGGIQVDSTAKFTTGDPYIQELLENSAGFGRDYYIESVREETAAQPEPEPKQEEAAEQEKLLTDVKDIKRFKNLVEMRNALAELGIENAQTMTYVQARAAAQKEGYDFQIKK